MASAIRQRQRILVDMTAPLNRCGLRFLIVPEKEPAHLRRFFSPRNQIALAAANRKFILTYQCNNCKSGFEQLPYLPQICVIAGLSGKVIKGRASYYDGFTDAVTGYYGLPDHRR